MLIFVSEYVPYFMYNLVKCLQRTLNETAAQGEQSEDATISSSDISIQNENVSNIM